jgi:hypothetical protein
MHKVLRPEYRGLVLIMESIWYLLVISVLILEGCGGVLVRVFACLLQPAPGVASYTLVFYGVDEHAFEIRNSDHELLTICTKFFDPNTEASYTIPTIWTRLTVNASLLINLEPCGPFGRSISQPPVQGRWRLRDGSTERPARLEVN